jgi:hypothetical protein
MNKSNAEISVKSDRGLFSLFNNYMSTADVIWEKTRKTNLKCKLYETLTRPLFGNILG